MRNFQTQAARVEAQWLLIGYAGASGSGKTWSALETATGICAEMGFDPATSIYMIDTENRRGLHYAKFFRFQHLDMSPPFNALDYCDAIDHVLSKGAKVIIIDSMSHEHEGEGGLIDTHGKEVERMSGGDYAKAERVKMLCWQKPKANRRKLMNKLTQSKAHFILCYRAKETAKPDPKAQGKDKVKDMGFTAIAGDEFIFEATISTVLMPGAQGVPTWQSDKVGEQMSIKVARQFDWVRDWRGPLNQDFGRRLAHWARGDDAPQQPAKKTGAEYMADIDALETPVDVLEWLDANPNIRDGNSEGAVKLRNYANEHARKLMAAQQPADEAF